MKETINKLEHLMTGLNYCTTFGYEELGIAQDLQSLKGLIINTFPDSKPFDAEIIEITEANFWEDIQFGLNYRGDYAAGMNLSSTQEAELKTVQEEFKAEIRKHIKRDSKFYHYPSETGIPGCEVMWHFRLIHSEGKKWFFVYGSASD